MTDEAYEQGKRDGRISHLESVIDEHKKEIDDIRKETKAQGRIISMLIGAFMLIQFLPEIKKSMGL